MSKSDQWRQSSPATSYSQSDAARLLGNDVKTIRAMLGRGALSRDPQDGTRVNGADVERHRAEMLTKLHARDSRPGVSDAAASSRPSPGNESIEVGRLRARLATAESNGRIAVAMLKLSIDALGSSFIPDDPQLIAETGGIDLNADAP